MRYAAPDPDRLLREIEMTRGKLREALCANDALATIDHAADLASMLTTARMETEAVALLQAHAALAESQSEFEPAGWYWNALATALQYAGMRVEAEPYFAKAVALARAAGWLQLLALALHHWGRSLVEQRRYSEAEHRIREALDIRVRLGETRQESSRRALDTLAEFQRNSGTAAGDGESAA